MFNKTKIIAHRGLHDNETIFENTLPAIKKARDKGYIIEIDVHLTKDNKIIVFHDYNAKRMINLDLIVEESTYTELQNNLIHIPLLEEVLDLVNKKTPLLIEIKQQAKIGPLETKLMDILNKYDGEYAIQSFNPKVLLWFKKHYPTILRGQLSYSFKNKKVSSLEKIILKNMIFNIITKPHFISYKYNEIKPSKLKKYQDKNIKTLGWTITTKEDYETYIKYFDNLICEKFIN